MQNIKNFFSMRFSPIGIRLRRFDQKSRKNQIFNYFILYTLLFLTVFTLLFQVFHHYGYSMVWILDGVDQHLTAFRYYGIQLRQMAREFLTTGRFVLPMWDNTIGQGADVITTLQYYCIGDPFALISALFPSAKAELGYTVSIMLRFYCAGLSFSIFCLALRQKRLAILSGSMIYVFCGYALSSFRHPYFLNPLVYLPLLCLGIEYILAHKKPHLFVFAVFISGISNFYFFYILSLLAALYAVVRFFSKYRKKEMGKNLFPMAGRVALFYGIGLALAAVLFIPVIKVLLSSVRLENGDARVFLRYTNSYYWNLINTFTGDYRIDYNSALGFASTGAISAAALFGIRKNRHINGMKWLYVLFFIFLCLPFAGFFFNGFVYVVNRWSFAISFLVAATTVIMIPRLSQKVSKGSFAAILIFAGILFCSLMFKPEYAQKNAYAGFAVLAVSLFLIYVLSSVQKRYKGHYDRLFSIAFLAITIFSISINFSFRWGQGRGESVKEYTPRGEAASANSDPLIQKQIKADRNGFYRVAPYRIWTYGERDLLRTERNYDARKYSISNTGMLQHYNGVGMYFSLLNPYYAQYCLDLALCDQVNGSRIYGLDNRPALNTLANVKYTSVLSGDQPGKAYGFEQIGRQRVRAQKTETLYQNSNYLPFGYTYSSVIPWEAYEKADPVQKQQMMLQGGVLSPEAAGVDLPQTKVVRDQISSPCKIRQKGADQSKKIVFEDNEKVRLSFQSKRECEVYLLLKNVKMDPKPLLKREINEKRLPDVFSLDCISGTAKLSARYATPEYEYAYNRQNMVFFLGYSNQPIKECTLAAADVTLSFDSIEIVSVPMDDFSAKVNALKADTMQNVKMETNHMSGTIDLKENKLLCMTIPYSEGWTAMVDGKPAELLRVNTMYTGLDLQPGRHTIELRYRTPLLLEGAILSGTTLAVYGTVTLIVFLRRRSRLKKGREINESGMK